MVKAYCTNTIHKYYEVDSEMKPKDDKCPFCGKFIQLKSINPDPNDAFKTRTKKVASVSNTTYSTKQSNITYHKPGETKTDSVSNEKTVSFLANDNSRRLGRNDRKPDGNIIVPQMKKKDTMTGEAMNKIIGMQETKEQLEILCRELDSKRTSELYNPKAKNLRTMENKHFLIMGSEKAGKTTLAKVISNILYEQGIRKNKEIKTVSLKKFHDVLKKDDADEVEKYLKQYADNTLLFDDNFDVIFQQSDGTYAVDHKVVHLLETVLDRLKGKVTLILETYEQAGKEMYHASTKLKDACELLTIGEYNNEELLQIAEKMYNEEYGYLLSKEAKMQLFGRIKRETFDANYSQGRFLYELFQEAKKRQAMRFAENCYQVQRNEDYHCFQALDLKERDLDEEKLKQLLDELDSMIGLENVKRNVKDMVNTALLNRQRIENDEKPIGFEFMNMLFLGPPGTGKTTVVDLIAKIYHCLGILKKDTVVYTSKDDLESKYVGDTSQRTQAKINEAVGGTLFIDEAYSLYCKKDEQGNNGKDIINTLVKNIGIHSRDLLVIMAGYPEDMEKLMTMNDGLPRRFPNKINFTEYSVDELTQIFYYKVKKEELEIEDNLECLVRTLLKERCKSKSFGNAGGVGNVLSDVIKHMSERLNKQYMKSGKCRFKIVEQDITALIENGYKEETLEDLLGELNSMIGLEEVKRHVNKKIEMLNGVKKLGNQSKVEISSNNMLFCGRPGTGKTTVAKLIVRIYQKLGLVKYGNVFKECRGRDLIAEYVGQTAANVRQALKEAEGGILFLDEAYALVDEGNGGYGKEAIDTLCAEIDNRGSDLVVIAAGYKDEMEKFLAVNEGMKRRFPVEINFEDYTTEELLEVFKSMIQKKGVRYNDKLEEHLLNLFMTKSKEKGFGNAGGIRNYADHVYENVMCRIGKEENYCEEMLMFTEADL